MKITAILAILDAAQGSAAYMVDAYVNSHCMGEVEQRINVHDNTCRDDDVPDVIRSIKLVGYGHHRQRASIYDDGWCNVERPLKEFWVDGGSVKIGDCINIHGIIKSYASWSR